MQTRVSDKTSQIPTQAAFATDGDIRQIMGRFDPEDESVWEAEVRRLSDLFEVFPS